MMNDCIFCKITHKEIPAEIVHETDETLAFLDINPVNFGHLLVIPKAHHQFMTDTPDDLVAKVFVTAKNLMPVLRRAVEANFVAVSVVGIDVPHFHVHLIPRFTNDGLKNFWPTKKYENDAVMKETADKIRSHLAPNH